MRPQQGLVARATSTLDRIEVRENPSVLVTIASYGTSQDGFLQKVISEYRRFRNPPRIVVLTNVNKRVEHAEVIVGLPTRNPYSLPFAPRKIMASRASDHDLFI